MIVTVTMNPAMDKTIFLQELRTGRLNRIEKTVLDPGGKGINVSKTIHVLGGETIATGFLAGSTGMRIEESLKKKGIRTDFIYVEGETRTNIKIIDREGTLTELNEQGPEIFQNEKNKLMEKLCLLAGENTLFILAGSVPKGVDKTMYREIIEMVKKKGAKVFLDADGSLLEEGIKGIPDIIKPNQFELEQYFAKTEPSISKDILKMGICLQQKGIENVLISRGKEGAVFLIKGQIVQAPALKIKENSSVGAGDAMVAAFAYGLEKNMDQKKLISFAMAVSAGAVETQGTKPPEIDRVEQLMKQGKKSVQVLDKP
ncbi:MAG: 1-phosphofructokinase [Acetivibrio sp.]